MSRVQQGSVSGPDETVHECLTVLLASSHLESEGTWFSAFPRYQSSTRKAGEKEKQVISHKNSKK